MDMKAQNSEPVAKKPRGKPFEKGQSGNPGGLTKDLKAAYKAMQESFQGLTDEARCAIVHVLRNGKDADRLSAAEIVLERGWGKPKQDVQLDANISGNIPAGFFQIELIEPCNSPEK